ncbi:hypothetical protein JL09_g7046, partial [Pichia kudriavzevii]
LYLDIPAFEITTGLNSSNSRNDGLYPAEIYFCKVISGAINANSDGENTVFLSTTLVSISGIS